MMAYIQLYENPFNVNPDTEVKFHNIITQEVMTDSIRESLLNIQDKGNMLYSEFRRERFVKDKRLSEPIHRNRIKMFNSISDRNLSTSSKKKRSGEDAAAHRSLEIYQARGHSLKAIFTYDIVPSNGLFDEDGLMKKPSKSDLCHELEKFIDINDEYSPSAWPQQETVCLVDVMANNRRVNRRGIRTFGDLCEMFMRMTLNTCKNAYRIDYIFDSYKEGSIKDSERTRRSNIQPVDINIIQEDTLLPVNMDTFWPSKKNKEKLQQLIWKWIAANSEYSNSNIQIVLSVFTTSSGICTKCFSFIGGLATAFTHLDSQIEEADVRLIPHALHATDSGAKRIVVITSDTDIMILALYFFQKLSNSGLTELWMRAGVGDTTRYIPLHLIAEKKPELCRVIPAAHILTGCDTTSKVGTKHSALKASSETFLSDFGKTIIDQNLEEIIAKAEWFLVKVLKNSSEYKTMDELRYSMYYTSKAIDINSLPPSSYSLRTHIFRCLYTCYIQINCLQNVDVDPTLFGYEQKNGLLLPVNNHRSVPDSLVEVCPCKKCSTKRCTCRKAGIPCCIFCHCSNSNSGPCCKNPHVLVSVPVVL